MQRTEKERMVRRERAAAHVRSSSTLSARLALCVIVYALLVAPAAAQRLPDSLAMHWQPVDSLNAGLPHGVRVFAGRNERLPLRAWYARINEPDPQITTRVVVSDEPDRREAVSTFARDSSACVAVNGGYFAVNRNPSKAMGLLVRSDHIVSPTRRAIVRDGQRYEAARAAIGLDRQDRVGIGWATTRAGTTYRWEAPPTHRPGHPGGPLNYRYAHPWHVRDAVSAGPMLLQDGRLHITSDEEVMFNTEIPNVHPRTAAGRTPEGDLIVMVVDGRQPASRGVDLKELARIARSTGATDALNLDGGGSSAMVVDGVLLNRPEGKRKQREVYSALVTYCGR